ncbi:MAG TPA: polyprenyl synthetase family protein, partial [Thermoclostridium caenicola]|nr:polyprenyl synthetase family protein [Thermoclostridium caenicola]
YLLAKSLRLLVETGLKPERLDVLARAVSMICEGEIDQYLGKYEIASVHVYLKRIMRKTGILFSAASLLGAKAGDLDESAFQIKDDMLDMESSERVEGKPVINDLKEGIVTLPVIFAVRNNPELKGEIEGFFDGKGDVREILKQVSSSGGPKDSQALKQKYVERCRKDLSLLPDSIAARALAEITEWL